MSRLNSVIRRYTPPTCTLEILGQSSPLSRLMGKTVIKQLTFELYFDAPQPPEEGKIFIQGDRDQLEILCDVVYSYVQDFIQQPPDNFWLNLTQPQDSSQPCHQPQLIGFNQSSLLNSNTYKSFTSPTSAKKIYLEPGNYLTHNLFLGSLANPTSGSVIKLSLLQLFDLATALDEYSADIMALPNINENNLTMKLSAWAPISPPEAAKPTLEPSPVFTPQDNLSPNSQLPTASFSKQPPSKFTPSLSIPSAQSPLSLFESPIATTSPQSETALLQKQSLPPSLSANKDKLVNISSLPPNNTNNNVSPTPSPSNSLVKPQQVSVNSSSTSQQVATSGTVLKTSQVAEAQKILTKRWQPPTGFTYTLEYSLEVDVDGKIEKIYPINKAAREFIDSSGMPKIGQPFVSASANGQNFSIRVLLSPNGKVQTFPED